MGDRFISSIPPPPEPDARATGRYSISGVEVPRAETVAGRALRIALAGRVAISALASTVWELVAWKRAGDARTARWGGRAGRLVWLVLAAAVVLFVSYFAGWLGGWHR